MLGQTMVDPIKYFAIVGVLLWVSTKKLPAFFVYSCLLIVGYGYVIQLQTEVMAIELFDCVSEYQIFDMMILLSFQKNLH